MIPQKGVHHRDRTLNGQGCALDVRSSRLESLVEHPEHEAVERKSVQSMWSLCGLVSEK